MAINYFFVFIICHYISHDMIDYYAGHIHSGKRKASVRYRSVYPVGHIVSDSPGRDHHKHWHFCLSDDIPVGLYYFTPFMYYSTSKSYFSRTFS